jgi:3-isopropylmalate/(R)-2-methylmalate dehydratase small subunit
MQKFTTLTAPAAAYLKPNVDTDLVIRVERCSRTPRERLGEYAFEMARFTGGNGDSGAPDPAFPLNRPQFAGAQILVGGVNFGCGSSREMAVWAIAGMGFRCVIAPSFGEIFYGNCFQNGLLAIRLPQAVVEALGGALLAAATPVSLTVDLARQVVIAPGGAEHQFEIDPLRKTGLLEGLDPIGLTLRREAEIAAWQAADRARRPWIYNA